MLFVLLFAACFQAVAQDQKVSGRVVSEADGSPLPGVSVTLKGTSSGTITDIDGNFSLNVPSAQSVLVFSFVGMETTEVTVGNQSTINLQLPEDVKALSEVVVVGYGEQQRRDVTGSVSSIGGEEINNLPVASIDAAMQGRAPGVLVTSPSGTPGAGISMQIRGSTSLPRAVNPCT